MNKLLQYIKPDNNTNLDDKTKYINNALKDSQERVEITKILKSDFKDELIKNKELKEKILKTFEQSMTNFTDNFSNNKEELAIVYFHHRIKNIATKTQNQNISFDKIKAKKYLNNFLSNANIQEKKIETKSTEVTKEEIEESRGVEETVNLTAQETIPEIKTTKMPNTPIEIKPIQTTFWQKEKQNTETTKTTKIKKKLNMPKLSRRKKNRKETIKTLQNLKFYIPALNKINDMTEPQK